MLIPLGTDRGLKRRAVVTPTIVGVTALAHIVMVGLRAADPGEADRLLEAFWVIGGDQFRWWQPVTSTLLHGGWWHLIGNLVFLWVFGPPVEDRLGRAGFLTLYVAGAFAAGGLHAQFEHYVYDPVVFLQDEVPGLWGMLGEESRAAAVERLRSLPGMQTVVIHVPAIGASGAIAALTGAFLVFFPRVSVRCFTFLGFGVIGVPAWWFIGLAIAWNLLAQSFGVSEGIAKLAHLGGYALGFAVAFVMLWLRVVPREMYDLFTVFRQAQRRRAFREATAQPARPVAAKQASAEASRALDELAERRAAVSHLLGEHRDAEAAEAYTRLVNDYAGRGGAVTLARDAQYRIAASLYGAGRQADAAAAFGRLLDTYPDDREADGIRVLVARMYAGQLGRREDARRLLGQVVERGRDADAVSLARAELEQIGKGESEGV